MNVCSKTFSAMMLANGGVPTNAPRTEASGSSKLTRKSTFGPGRYRCHRTSYPVIPVVCEGGAPVADAKLKTWRLHETRVDLLQNISRIGGAIASSLWFLPQGPCWPGRVSSSKQVSRRAEAVVMGEKCTNGCGGEQECEAEKDSPPGAPQCPCLLRDANDFAVFRRDGLQDSRRGKRRELPESGSPGIGATRLDLGHFKKEAVYGETTRSR